MPWLADVEQSKCQPVLPDPAMPADHFWQLPVELGCWTQLLLQEHATQKEARNTHQRYSSILTHLEWSV